MKPRHRSLLLFIFGLYLYWIFFSYSFHHFSLLIVYVGYYIWGNDLGYFVSSFSQASLTLLNIGNSREMWGILSVMWGWETILGEGIEGDWQWWVSFTLYSSVDSRWLEGFRVRWWYLTKLKEKGIDAFHFRKVWRKGTLSTTFMCFLEKLLLAQSV